MNHKKLFFTGVLALCLAVPASAQKMQTVVGEGRYTSRTLADVPAFTEVEVRGDAEVDFMQQPNTSVSISGAENLVQMSDVRVENGVLVVGFTRPVHIRGERHLKVTVSAPTLEKVSVQQGGEFEVRGSLHTNKLMLMAEQDSEISADHIQASSVLAQASGRAEIDLNRVQADRVEATAEGRADVDLSGDVQEAVLTNNGAGEVDAEDLRAATVTATANASGDIKAFPSETFYANANGRGTIEYKGYPTTVKRTGNTRKIRRDRDDDHDYDDDDYDD